MYIVKVEFIKMKNTKNSHNEIVSTRYLEQSQFKTFENREDAINFIEELPKGIQINKYGNSTEITGAKIFRQVNDLAIDFYKEVK